MIIDAFPEDLKMPIYRELRAWYLALDLDAMSRPAYIKLTGHDRPPESTARDSGGHPTEIDND